MAFEKGNEHRMKPGDPAKNRMGRPKSATTIRLETLRELRYAAEPLISRAIKLAMEGSEPALCAVIGLLASGYGETPAKPVKASNSAVEAQ
jgi:hypothetical protein